MSNQINPPMKQGDWVYAWNSESPSKKNLTRFLHRLSDTSPSNICVSQDTLPTYPTRIHLKRYDIVVPAHTPPATPNIILNGIEYKAI